MTFEEFLKTTYYTQYHVHIPLLNRMKLQKTDYFTKGKFDTEKLNTKLYEIYEKNKQKL